MSPTEADISSVRELKARINSHADAVTARIRKLDEILEGAGVEVDSELCIGSARERERDDFIEVSYYLGYKRPDEGSPCIVVEAVAERPGEMGAPELYVRWRRPLVTCSREMRLSSEPHLEALFDKVHAALKDATNDLPPDHAEFWRQRFPSEMKGHAARASRIPPTSVAGCRLLRALEIATPSKRVEEIEAALLHVEHVAGELARNGR